VRVMRRGFNTLSQRFIIAGSEVSPQAVMNTILLGIIQQVGPSAVGHAKAVAQVDGGIVHASTTGTPPTVEIQVAGNPALTVNHLQVDLLCVFHGVTRKILPQAWQEVLARLARDGFVVTILATPQSASDKQRPQVRTRMSILTSVLPSFLVLKPCCLLPMGWSLFGGTVGVLHIFAPLEPYRPLFILVSLVLLSSAFYQLYLRPPALGFGDTSDSVFKSHVLFWLASSLFIGAALSPLVLPGGF
jgi:hypothetical protein